MRFSILLTILMLSLLSGCDYTRDASKSERVRMGGLIGRSFELQREAVLVKGDRPAFLNLQDASKPLEPEQKLVGVVERGTQFRVEKVVLFNYGWLPSPALAPSDTPYTIARILNGPYSGKEVATGSYGLEANVPSVNENHFRELAPASQSSKIRN